MYQQSYRTKGASSPIASLKYRISKHVQEREAILLPIVSRGRWRRWQSTGPSPSQGFALQYTHSIYAVKYILYNIAYNQINVLIVMHTTYYFFEIILLKIWGPFQVRSFRKSHRIVTIGYDQSYTRIVNYLFNIYDTIVSKTQQVSYRKRTMKWKYTTGIYDMSVPETLPVLTIFTVPPYSCGIMSHLQNLDLWHYVCI